VLGLKGAEGGDWESSGLADVVKRHREEGAKLRVGGDLIAAHWRISIAFS
jgi:hypothetical protein